jgi:hypothetical protein
MTKRPALSFDEMTVGLLFAVLAMRALLMSAQSDTYWTLRAGADLWRTGHIPRVESYSFTAAGLPWPDHEWLWQAFAAALHRAGGMPLFTAAGAALALGAVAVVYRLMVGAASTRFALLLLAIPLASALWALRPQILTLFFLALCCAWLARERFARLPLLFVVWANAHGGVVLGGVLVVAAFVAALARARLTGAPADRARVARLGLVVPACALATTATPLGFGIFRFVLDSESRLRALHIREWLPTVPGLSIEGVFWLLAAAFLWLLARRWRSLRDAAWVDWAILACVLALFPLAFRSVRHIGPFLMLVPAAASRLLGPDFRLRRKGAPLAPSTDHPGVNAAIVALVSAGVAATVAAGWTRPFEGLVWHPVPDAVLAAVRACRGPLYNHYDQGGFLVWFTPERKVFVDNRQDPYPLPFLLEHIRVEAGTLPHAPLFARYGIRCSFLAADSPTVAGLAKEGWRSLYRDDAWAVQAAPGSSE